MRRKKHSSHLAEIKYFLVQISKYSSWFLLVIILLYMISGYTLIGKSFLGIVLPIDLAEFIHYNSDIYLYIFLILHVIPYLLVEYRLIK